MSCIVLSCFPGTGRTFAHNHLMHVYSYDYDGILSEDFPNKYMDFVEARYKEFKKSNNSYCILIPIDKIIRDELKKRKIPYGLVFPDSDLVDEYTRRLFIDKQPLEYIQNVQNNWFSMLKEIYEDGVNATMLELSQGETVSTLLFYNFDIIPGIFDEEYDEEYDEFEE